MVPRFVIAGGGLAGLACGIELARRGLDVEVHEKGAYPLRKVCGEFLSPLGWQTCRELGAAEFLALPPVPVSRAAFYYFGSASFSFALRPGAWGLSRQGLDSALAASFRKAGGRLHENSPVEPPAAPDPERVWVDARGRRAGRGKELWLGWKGYMDAWPPGFDPGCLHMFSVKNGYCGLCAVEDGRANVSFLARSPCRPEEVLGSHPVLARLAPAIRHFASVAGFSLSLHDPDPPAIPLGDRWGTWPPLAGDGMTAAMLAGRRLGSELWPNGPSTSGLARAHGRALFLHRLAMHGPLRLAVGSLCHVFPGLAGLAYRLTRTPDSLE